MSRPWMTFKDAQIEHASDEVVGPGGFASFGSSAVQILRHLETCRDLAKDCESPIEVEFGAYLTRQLAGTGLEMVPQYKWQRYRMDFAIMRDKSPVVFIECDGKEFHSTEEQIANDRRKDAAALEAGIQLLRFTGSEIYKNAPHCAAVAIGAAGGPSPWGNPWR